MTQKGPPMRIQLLLSKILGLALGVGSMVIGVGFGIQLLGKDMTFPEGFAIVFPMLFVLCGGWLVGDILFGREK